MDIVIIGAIAAGMSVAAKAKRQDRTANITVIDKEDYVSFGACGLPYYIGNEFSDENEMYARTPEKIRESGIELLLKHEVIDVDFNKKELVIKGDNRTFKKTYDRLVIATGASPIILPLQGSDSENVYTITKPYIVNEFKKNLEKYNSIAIIGGGFIGVEVADQLSNLGKKVMIIESTDRLLRGPFDQDISEKIKEALEENNIDVKLEEKVEKFNIYNNLVSEVKTNKGNYKVDAVIMAVGFKPNTKFLGDDIRLNENGAILIDEFGETSIKDVYSAGDCATINHRLLGISYIPLATVANKLGRVIGINIVSDRENREKFTGVLGSSSIKVGRYEAGSTGLTEDQAKKISKEYKTTLVKTVNHSNYYRNQEPIFIKLIYDANTYVLYGAQIFGKCEAVLRMTGLSVAIHAKMTTKELGFVDFAYAPPFASTWEAINVAANAAK